MLTAFTVSTISQCFLFSVFFTKANIAACVAGFLYFMLYLPYPLCTQWEELMTFTSKSIAVCIKFCPKNKSPLMDRKPFFFPYFAFFFYLIDSQFILFK